MVTDDMKSTAKALSEPETDVKAKAGRPSKAAKAAERLKAKPKAGRAKKAPAPLKRAKKKPERDDESRSKAGRPFIIQAEQVAALETYFSMGYTDGEACRLIGVSPDSLRNFFNRYPKERERLCAKRRQPTVEARAAILAAMRGVNGAPPDIALCKWFLEKQERAAFGSDWYVAERQKAFERDGEEDNRHAIIPADLVGSSFADFFRDVKEHKYTHYRETGGRGAGRSTAISLAVVNLLMNNSDIHAVICRKVGNTLMDSVFSQICWAIDALGLEAHFKTTKKPLLINREATGQTIYFRGLDDPGKIKSVKPRFGYTGVFWLEEADQTSGEDELRPVRQSVMRGGNRFWLFESWNTPRKIQHWINQRELDDANRPDIRTHHATYLTTPVEWLGRPFIEEAEALKIQNEIAYRHEYLGEAVGYGGEVFGNISLEKISEESIKSFDNVKMGIDWGYTVDPLAFVKMHYDKTRKVLFIFDELVATRLSDEEAARLIRMRDVGRRDVITADCEDPKSIDNFRRMGFYVIGCVKFKGSVAHGIKFLQDLTLIVIDPVRCPVAAKEFAHATLRKDSAGDFMAQVVDKNNHCIDAARYALDEYISSYRETTTSYVKAS